MSEQPTLPNEKWRQRFLSLRSFGRRTLPFVSGVLATFVALLLYNAFVPKPTPITVKDVNDTIEQAMAEATPAPAFSASVFQIIHPSIVLIQVNNEDERGRESNGLGTGVVVNQDGNILTSLHVVTNTDTIQVIFADGTKSNAQVIVAQPEHDIAVLAASKLPSVVVPATLGNPNALRVGDEAYVVGHPLGLYDSMSAGIISGFDRSFTPQNSAQKLEGLIQIDAAVNPGNSGGPLLNRYGEVVGIVAGLVNPTEESFFIGIGFAVPINVAGGAAGLLPY
ncbi:MAG: trypsin-like peptidase domain-containing protein [Caldilineaceae bacterium]